MSRFLLTPCSPTAMTSIYLFIISHDRLYELTSGEMCMRVVYTRYNFLLVFYTNFRTATENNKRPK